MAWQQLVARAKPEMLSSLCSVAEESAAQHVQNLCQQGAVRPPKPFSLLFFSDLSRFTSLCCVFFSVNVTDASNSRKLNGAVCTRVMGGTLSQGMWGVARICVQAKALCALRTPQQVFDGLLSPVVVRLCGGCQATLLSSPAQAHLSLFSPSLSSPPFLSLSSIHHHCGSCFRLAVLAPPFASGRLKGNPPFFGTGGACCKDATAARCRG